MKKMILALVAVLIMAGSVPPAQAAFEASGDVYVGVSNMYLWRGFDLSPDSDFVVQPGMDISVGAGPGSLTFSYWSNLDEDSGELNETDLIVDYSFDLGEYVSASVGNIFYALEGLDDTNELYLSLGVNVLLSPTLSIYYDYDEAAGDGLFYTLSVGHDFGITDELSLSLGALVSYNQESDYAVGDFSDLHNAEVSLGLDYAITDQISAGILGIYSTELSDDAEDIAGIEGEGLIGASLTFAF